MEYFPIFMKLRGRSCLVVGGGSVARRKVALLLEAGAHVTVEAPELEPELTEWAASGRLAYRRRRFVPESLAGVALVVVATDDPALNARVSRLAQARNLPVNVVDDGAASTFIVPSIVDRSPVMLAISSGGKAPVLARLLKARLEQLVGQGYGWLAGLAGAARGRVKARLPDTAARNQFWEQVFQGPVAELALAGRREEAERTLAQAVESAEPPAAPMGMVHLVGAGPGDPELLTLRAARLLQEADVIVHDRLVAPEILAMARRDAERIDVGKVPGHSACSQERINTLLVRLARAGQRVIRLKGGDPFVFGRGGEEQDALTAAGIRCEVVPGITAALGCAARLGIPLTHRDHAHSVILTTGHPRRGDKAVLPKVSSGQTQVIYMGLHRLAEVCAELCEQGLSLDTPAVLAQDGTTPRQRAVAGSLGELPALAAAMGLRSPALLIVGDVVRRRAVDGGRGLRDEVGCMAATTGDRIHWMDTQAPRHADAQAASGWPAAAEGPG